MVLAKIKWRFKYARWLVTTVLLLPVAIPIFLLTDTLVWLGEKASALSERFSRWKHRVAPFPLTDEEKEQPEWLVDEDL